MIWTIETGSFIQVPDAAWNILTLYSKTSTSGKDVYCIVGFVTAYKYWVYDKYSHSVDKSRLRVSQVVVLPPFQRKGHGGRMLRAVYKHAQSDPSILDVFPLKTLKCPRELAEFWCVAGECRGSVARIPGSARRDRLRDDLGRRRHG